MRRLHLAVESTRALRGSLKYCHTARECVSSAFEKKEKNVRIRLCIPRELGAVAVSLDIYNEGLTEKVLSVLGTLESEKLGEERYLFSLSTESLSVGLYFLKLRISCAFGTLFCYGDPDGLWFSEHEEGYGLPQLTLCEFKHPEPESMYGGVIYHIFVDRFARGGEYKSREGSRLISGEWDRIPEYPEYPGAPLKNNTFYGGTLDGVASRLDYIASLGVNTIYLSPIFDSVSNHKYDTADYMRVDPAFGGDGALSRLIEECKKRGIRLILDGVFNHTGADSVYFNRYGSYGAGGAYRSKESPFYPWFDFKSYPDKYTCWWDIEILPRINPDIPECGEYFVGKGGVIEKYRDMGIYGFRLDVADELSDGFISRIKSTLSKEGESMLYGEVWEDASNKIAYDRRKTYYLGDELDGVMNYPLRAGLIDYVLYGWTEKLSYALGQVTRNAPDRILHAQMNLLGTHDTERIITVLGGESGEGFSNAELRDKRMTAPERAIATRRLKAAYTVLATLPGIPAVFYGDEAGLEGYGDPFNRMPYPYGREDRGLIEHYSAVGSLRGSNPVYKKGGFRLLALDSDLLIFERLDKKYVYLTVLNRSAREASLSFGGVATECLSGRRGRAHTLPPISAEVYKVKKNIGLEIEK